MLERPVTTSTHPRTSRLRDPDLPAVSTLLDSQPPSPLRAAVDAAGGTLEEARVTGVTWWPGSSITVTYRAEVTGGEASGPQEFVAMAGSIPEGALVVSAGDETVGVWRVPHDPGLPGLAAALDPRRAGEVLSALGAVTTRVRTRMRAYRAGRRSVVSVEGSEPGLFFKVVGPSQVGPLHARHRAFPAVLPVPRSMGVDRRLGILALEALPGRTLRRALEDLSVEPPPPSEVVELVSDLPPPQDHRSAPSPIERAPRLASLLEKVVPEEAVRIARLVEAIGDDDVVERVPVHGDYYEAQVLVAGDRIAGLLDVDTYGWGRPSDDPATMLGHLAVWARLSREPTRVNRYAAELLRRWDARVDPADLRRRVAAVVLGLATGPFRVQRADWPGETSARLDLAERWVASSARVDERRLMAGSG